MKKVLIFVDALYEGGVSKVLLDLLENINRDKYDITVMTLYNQGIYIDSVKNMQNINIVLIYQMLMITL